jgi:4-amino-4-deoxy-L-arabinose transferase-like glycosyltransferase
MTARPEKSLSWLPPLLAVAVYFVAAIGRAIADADEANYVHIAQQMLERSDWITPHANGLRYLNKPPLLLWLLAGSFQLFGISELAARLPGIAGIAATTWLVQRIATLAAGARAGVAAGLAFAFCVGTAIFTLEVMTDIVLVFFVTLAMYCFVVARQSSYRVMFPVLGFFAAVAGAFMTKSLTGVVFPCGAVVLCFAVTRERPRVPLKSLALGCLLFVGLVVPWHVAAEIRNPGFLRHVFFNEQILRFFGERPSVDYTNVPVWLFWILTLAWMFPWTAFLPAAVLLGRTIPPKEERQKKIVVLAMCWAGVVLAFFTISDRLEHYAFPALPALAILIGVALASIHTPAHHAVRRAFLLLGVVGVVVLVAGGLGFAWVWGVANSFRSDTGWSHSGAEQMTDFGHLFNLPPNIVEQLLHWPFAAAVLSVSFGLLAAYRLEVRAKRQRALLVMAGAMIVFCLAASYSLKVCEPVVSSKTFGDELSRLYVPGDRVVIVGDFWTANSINFYAPVRLYVYDGRAYAFYRAMQYPDAPKMILSHSELEEPCFRARAASTDFHSRPAQSSRDP